MRKALIICGILALCLIGWKSYSRRSVSVEIAPGYALTYTVAWGWGMDQQLTLAQRWVPHPIASSEWIEIWKRPYNSGAAVYATEQGDRFFVGTSYRLQIVDISQRKIFSTCDTATIPTRKTTPEQLPPQGSAGDDEAAPQAPGLMRYILPETPAGAAPTNPPPSRYYVGLRYLGRFGIVGPQKSASSRGSEVGFVPAQNEPEPRLALQVHCG
jgi:hypothetical protein